MQNTLSIRAYTKQSRTHLHDYHQLVLPTQGHIAIEIPGFQGQVGVGECVIIKRQHTHRFTADEAARFVVADLSELPPHLEQASQTVFRVSDPMRSFLHFIEQQLRHQVQPNIEHTTMMLFQQLLAEQEISLQVDERIRRVLNYIVVHLAAPIALEQLAQEAHLSSSQFKTLFKKYCGQAPMQYITEQRMEKAKALLTHTDLPIHLVAEQVGYTDLSAFSRRFSNHFGLSPSALAKH